MTHCILLFQGLKAIYSPYTGVANYGAVTNRLIELFLEAGGETYTDFEVCGFSQGDTTDFNSVNIYSKNKVR